MMRSAGSEDGATEMKKSTIERNSAGSRSVDPHDRGKITTERGSPFLLDFTLTLEDTLTFYEESTVLSQALPRADET